MILQDNIFLSIVLLTFGLSAFIQVIYYLYFYLATGLYRHRGDNKSGAAVSVVICARNEAENLRKFLPAVLEQKYSDYEVIVVNDCSDDDTFDVLGQCLTKYSHLRVSTVNKDPKFTHNKKFAQFIGIKAAKNDILLFTDADCQPESDRWLAEMTSHFDESTDFVLGYGGYFKDKGLLNKYIRYDSMTIAMQYLGMAIRGIPYMGVGRNLAYRREVFFRNKGYGSHYNLISGDDDLFVNHNATKRNTCVEFRREAHVRSVPAATITEWFKQKRRHLTTARYYKFGNRLLLFIEPLSRTFFYVSLAILLAYELLLPYVASVFGIRLIIQVIVLALVRKKLQEPGLVLYSLFFDIFSPLITGIVYVSNLRNRSDKHRWK
jgi:cellulose synthase/poly-beta-1,6-N-acetylglucosamine synthase-like glycosyltransferase